MVITILEGEVSPDQAPILLEAYKKTIKKLPPEIIKTYLIKSIENKNIWRIMTIWRSKKALEEMRKFSTPAGVLMFRSAGTEPTLSIYELAEYAPK